MYETDMCLSDRGWGLDRFSVWTLLCPQIGDLAFVVKPPEQSSLFLFKVSQLGSVQQGENEISCFPELKVNDLNNFQELKYTALVIVKVAMRYIQDQREDVSEY